MYTVLLSVLFSPLYGNTATKLSQTRFSVESPAIYTLIISMTTAHTSVIALPHVMWSQYLVKVSLKVPTLLEPYYSTSWFISLLPSDVNTDPRSGDVRLIDSAGNTNISAGRVEMYYEGSWVTFCGLEFEAANFVCWLTVRGRYHRNGTVMDL